VLASVGVTESGVREIAVAAEKSDGKELSKTVAVLHRICWLTGLLGAVMSVLLAAPLSRWMFGTGEHSWVLMILSGAVFLEIIASGQKAALQGLRRIGDLARVQLSAACISTIVSIALYAWLGEKGIVPVLLAVSAIQLVSSWYFARRISLEHAMLPWGDSMRISRQMVGLGLTFMYSSLLTVIAGLVIRGLISRDLGLDAAGIYQAAWALSGMFGSFILQAMATDFYPRLAAASGDDSKMSRLICEQIEVGVFLALPASLFAVATSPWLIWLFYSAKFLEAAAMIPWFVLGVFFQVVGWPMATVMPAKSAAGWSFFSRTHGLIWQIGAAVVLLHLSGLVGVAVAFAVYTFAQLVIGQLIARSLCRFRLQPECRRVLLLSCSGLCISLALFVLTPRPIEVVLNLLLAFGAGIFCLRALSHRLEASHPVVRVARLLRLQAA